MQNGDLSNFRRASAGFAAGITEALVVVTPFEVVKIKLQQQKGTSKELLRYRVCKQILLHLNTCEADNGNKSWSAAGSSVEQHVVQKCTHDRFGGMASPQTKPAVHFTGMM